MAEVGWTDGAIDDLREIVRHISRQYPFTAEKVRLRILDSTRQLEQFPERGARVPEFELDHVREIIVGSFRVIYILSSERSCLIAAIHRGSKDLVRWFDPDDYDPSQ